MQPRRLLSTIAATAAIGVLAACTSVQAPPSGAAVTAATASTTTTTATAAPQTIQPPPALHLEGVPPLPASLLAVAERYNRVAGHVFADWHPTRREMLLTHRAPSARSTQLYLLRAPLATPELLTSGDDPPRNAQWEPRAGRYIVFARGSGGDEAYQLYRLDPATRSTTQLTADGERHALHGWLKTRGLAIVGSLPLDRAGARQGELMTTLSLLDPLDPHNPASRRQLARLAGGGWSVAEASPDDTQLALTRYLSDTEAEVWLLDVASGRTRQLLPAPGTAAPKASHYASHWSADGRSVFVNSDAAGEFQELVRVDVASGALTRLTAAIPWGVENASPSPDRRHTALVINADGRDELRLVDSNNGQALPLPPLPAGSLAISRYHPAQEVLALVVNSMQGPAQIQVLDLQTRQVTPWTQAVGTEGLELAELPEQQIVRWKSFDGRVISGVLSLPPARFGNQRPVMMVLHGGPASQSKQGWQGRRNYLLLQLGVAVFEPNVRGSRGYGKTFVGLDNGRQREDSVKDVGTAIDWIATQPRLDAARVLVVGGSYGGYMALAASTRLADRIAGASATVGIGNFVSFLENTETYRRDLRRVEYGDERDPAMRAFLHEISPLTHVDKITKPLMVVQGRNDPRVPWTESEQIVRSLQARGTPVWYLLADNEGHGFARRENADFYFAALLQFVQQTLRP